MPAPPPNLVRRAAWQAALPRGPFEAHTVSRLTIHHTAVPLDARPTAARLCAFQRHHQSQGWPDIAYHLVVGTGGAVYEGRPLDAAGDSATGYDPAGHLLVAVDGDFTREHPTAAQLDALEQLIAWAATTYTLDPADIRGHSNYAATACPGDHLAALIADGSLAPAP